MVLIISPVVFLAVKKAEAGCGMCHYNCVAPFGGFSLGATGQLESSPGNFWWTCNDSIGGITVPNACFQGPGICGTPLPVNGSCASSHYACLSGTSINNASNPTTWTWRCQGSGGGSTASCTENKLFGTVNVTSNVGASWTITGPTTINDSGTSQSSPSQPVGIYTITWGGVSGYRVPASQSLTLIGGGTITFNGNYVATPDLTASVVMPNTATIDVPITFSSTITNSGTGSTQGSTVEGTMTTYSGTGGSPRKIAFDGTNMWTVNENNSVTKISPTGVMNTYPLAGSWPSNFPRSIAFDGTNMWTADFNANSVTKISPTGVSLNTYTGTGAAPVGIAFDGTNMWTVNTDGNSVTRISPTGVMNTYPTASFQTDIAFDGINMWTSSAFIDSVTKISPTGVATIYPGTGGNPSGIAFDGTNMWLSSGGNGATRISPTGVMTSYTGTGGWQSFIAFDGINMWISKTSGVGVKKVLPTGVMTLYTGTGMWPMGIAFDGTNMWTANIFGDSVTKIGVGGGFFSLFQVASAPNGGGMITDVMPQVPTSALAAGANTIISRNYTFTTPGTYSVRACADKYSATGTGTITESDETNNCSPWTDITISGDTLKICPNPCDFAGTSFNGMTFTSVPTTLYACYGTGDCSAGDTNVNGTWSATNVPNDAINLSSNSGTSVGVSSNYSGLGTVTENITISYLSATPAIATASVSCVPFTCGSPSIISQRASYCPSVTNTFDDNCGGVTAACDGTKNCDFNWREIAP